ncbi:hypothetical protein B0J18DRAFT_220794 [Chaetomium sp. MPI-SDFR-AT-0129]|nr:hypothetical protein B0J18DRAFT_220794 [Chaetomium sp. MPI-SDFR-AT-0129]
MNKNWNDRADKDLFFTILSVKNIGVISGSEWITIGNHMRSLGYGFTNEGCRQHFQGLRRAQNKTEHGVSSETPRRVDPTLNPITRRPGPGRGRPRKHPLGDAPAEGPSGITLTPGPHPIGVPPGVIASNVPGAAPPVPGGALGAGIPHGVAIHPQFPGLQGVNNAQIPPGSDVTVSVSNAQISSNIPSTPQGLLPASQLAQQQQQQQQQHHQQQHEQQIHTPTPQQVSQDLVQPVQIVPASVNSTGLGEEDDGGGDDDEDGDEAEGEHIAKRQRLGDDTQESPTLEDEAVLNALAGHNNAASPGEYETEYTYGDA